ncbi:alpha-amylase family protein [Actinotignum urinale]|uniref:Alpha-amylase family protein n=1 Tax=Actinotignum urinale TaxID=190146 RepID=A0AAW9HMF1_9ACTO|nr:alpha-amylase family protein [Actinotignum urinale]MDY5155075.1 alpha-amylase family protein [Actinotignum urinale]
MSAEHPYSEISISDAQSFELRVERYGKELREGLSAVYGECAQDTWDQLLDTMRDYSRRRKPSLKIRDEERLLSPDWLLSSQTIGYVAYADRFAGNLQGVNEHVDYLEELGVTYLHLMPLLAPRPGANDGGYAVMDYESVRPDLGTMDDVENLADTLHSKGMNLVLDLVLNHVAREHEWAVRARQGEEKYRDYFYMYSDRTIPDQFEVTLPEVFPDFAPGNFTWDEDAKAWVWTTFNSYQWDVNWSNPDVFLEYCKIIFNLVNKGVDVIRLDAIAFIWKQTGTTSQCLPQVHWITQALRAALRIVAPSAAFKAEAIVSPELIMPFLGTGKHWGKVSDMAYHNSLMVQLWSTLASRDTRLMKHALNAFARKPSSTVWGTYARCHDDIGWAISDKDAGEMGLNGYLHRSFLSDFYSGIFPESFARGLVFQYNPVTNDRRISGSMASLAGLEIALENGEDPYLAVSRIVMLNAAILGFGGVPLLYMGDELGLLNDYGYVDNPEHAEDNRWVHRPKMPWDIVEEAKNNPQSIPGQIYHAILHLIKVRKSMVHLHAAIETEMIESPDSRLALWLRAHPEGNMLQVYNFSEHVVEMPTSALRPYVGWKPKEVIGGYTYDLGVDFLNIQPYQSLWFIAE